jgi:hypothetical protein
LWIPQKPTKIEKVQNFMFLSAGCSFLRAEGFSCSLGVLYGGLGRSKLQFLIKKIEKVIKPWIRIWDPYPGSRSAIRKNAGSGSISGSAFNQCGSETLSFRSSSILILKNSATFLL